MSRARKVERHAARKQEHAARRMRRKQAERRQSYAQPVEKKAAKPPRKNQPKGSKAFIHKSVCPQELRAEAKAKRP